MEHHSCPQMYRHGEGVVLAPGSLEEVQEVLHDVAPQGGEE